MTPGNYSVHFREWYEQNYYRFQGPHVANDYRWLGQEMARAEHFILPDGGRLIGIDNMPDDTEHLLRPPYPVTAVEFAVTGDPGELERSSRRIVLVHDEPDNAGVRVTPVAFYDRQGDWVAGVSALIPYGNWWDSACQAIRATPEAFAGASADPAAMFDDCVLDVRAYIEMCLALSCSNVGAEKIVAPEKLNKARARRGKPAFRDYHVLTVPGGSHSSGGGANTGRSVRTHLRRGHIRRLPDRRIWVNACVVKGGHNGFVSKDYRVAC